MNNLRNKISPKNRFLTALLSSTVLIASGCTSVPNLSEIKDLAGNSVEAKQKLPAIANDFYPSCLRAARYQPVNILPSDDGSAVLLTTTSLEIEDLSTQITALESQLESNPALSAELEDLRVKLNDLSSSSSNNREPLQARIDFQKDCNDTESYSGESQPQIPRRYLASAMKTGNDVMTGYVIKLGELAGVEIDFSKEFGELTTSSTNLRSKLGSLFGQSGESGAELDKKINAGFDIAQFITTQIFGGIRRDTLEEAIVGGNDPLQNYAEGLQTVVRRVYIDQYLKTEERQLDEYYITYISDILDSQQRREGNSVIQIAELLIEIDQDRWNPEKDKIQERRELGYQYIDLLQTIKEGHQELADLYMDGSEPSEQALNEMVTETNLALKEFTDKAKSVEKMH